MAYRVTNELEAASNNNNNIPVPVQNNGTNASSSESVSVTTGAAAGSIAGSKRVMDEEEERDAVFYRLEMLGYRVGQGLVERYVHVHSAHTSRTESIRG